MKTIILLSCLMLCSCGEPALYNALVVSKSEVYNTSEKKTEYSLNLEIDGKTRPVIVDKELYKEVKEGERRVFKMEDWRLKGHSKDPWGDFLRIGGRKKRRNQNETRNLARRLFRVDEGYSRWEYRYDFV